MKIKINLEERLIVLRSWNVEIAAEGDYKLRLKKYADLLFNEKQTLIQLRLELELHTVI